MVTIATPRDAAVRLDPVPRSTSEIHGLALRFLELTASPAARLAWGRERAEARTMLRQVRQPGYLESEDAVWDLDFILDIVSEIEAADEEPPVAA